MAMTPQEIFDYKIKWMPGYSVTIHSDLRSPATQWCKLWMNPIHWKHIKHTDVYQDTFHFAKLAQAKGFAETFPDYAEICS